MTTRFVGELPLDAAPAPPASPGAVRPQGPSARPEDFLPRAEPEVPRPDRVEVTQPYIPAIRDERPEFAKRLNPDPPAARAATAEPAAPRSPQGTVADLAPVTPAAAPAAPPVPAPDAAPVPAAPQAEPAGPAKRQPVRRRSLARRVVRRIIGPDLLRKDPPKKRR
ncbi:hypothetical protein [Saccharopolyspora gloriosae]|uniref:hypothetical protein n=1 Tax=Saccharopolyspora gloriosae TaxID=455344 RepID=UPI00286809DC|nr:hypothetical protein [Saccharopolyspora gloriosae]